MEETPFACSLPPRELARRREEWRELEERALIRSEARPDGRVVVYRGGEDTGRALSALIEAERDCCPWLRFRLRREDGEIRLEIDVPPEAREMAAELGVVGRPSRDTADREGAA